MFGIKKLKIRLDKQRDVIINLSGLVGEIVAEIEVIKFNKGLEMYGLEVEYKSSGLAKTIMGCAMYDVYKDGEFYASFESMADVRKWFAGYESGVDDINVTIECDCDDYDDEPFECDDMDCSICNDCNEPEVTIMPTKKPLSSKKKK